MLSTFNSRSPVDFSFIDMIMKERSHIVGGAGSKFDAQASLHENTSGSTESSFVDAFSVDLRAAIEKTLQNVEKTSIVEEFFLESLAFATMNDREEEIPAAHKATFEWILNSHGQTSESGKASVKAKDVFIDWLRGNQQSSMYWISGKPGSGKSTLMRYIYENPKTIEQLQLWAGTKPLICTRFFFWTSGTFEQKSHSGLLRSLLHQLLEQNRASIPWVFPGMWLEYQDTKKRGTAIIPWTTELMTTALKKFLLRAAGQSKICFFIDGLDELEGDQSAMVEMLRDMLQFSPGDFKACVSSRPWTVFETAFSHISQLKLQDLTVEDISRFVEDSLNGAPKLRRILKKEPEAAIILKSRMIEHADGVFLWATLAVKEMIERTSSGDTIADLLQKFDALPLDLDDLFRYLLSESKTKEALEDQSRIFQIVRAREVVCDFTRDESSNYVTIYELALADQIDTFDISQEVGKPSDEKIEELCKLMSDLLQTRCAGLLRMHLNGGKSTSDKTHRGVMFAQYDGISPELFGGSRVGYLHRTVKDFLVNSGGLETISKNTNQNFNPHISLLRSHILQLRLPLEEPEKHRRLDEWWPDIILAMTHARFAGLAIERAQIDLLNHFKNTLDWYWRKKQSDPLDNWARGAFATYEIRMKHRTPYHYPFLSLSTKFGLLHYLESEIRTGNYPYKGGIPLLSYAVDFLVHRQKTVYPFSTPEMVEMLLENGQDPNLVYQNLQNVDETPWLLALKYVRQADRRSWIKANDHDENGTKRWVTILKSFIKHGADPNAMILKDRWDPAATALDVVMMVNGKYQSLHIERLLGLLVEHGASDLAASV